MKYFQNPADSSIWAYEEDGSQDHLIPEGFFRLTDAQAQAALVNLPSEPYIPFSVTPFQAKAALFQAGLLPSVQAAIAAASPIAQLAWSDATEFTRDSPTIASLSAQLGLSSAQVDALFIAAAAIEA